MKIIFLDIDGVLNYDLWYTSETYRNIMSTSENFDLDIDPINAKLINSICKKTNAKIVITSDKRFDWNDTLMQLKRGGINIDLIIDKTPEILWERFRNYDEGIEVEYDCIRGNEIKRWLYTHPEVKKYVIIDDILDFSDEQLPFLVKVNPHIGLTDNNINEILKILNDE